MHKLPICLYCGMNNRTKQSVPGYGAKLVERLGATGLTQVELANASGLSRQTISQLIARDEASWRTIALIEEVLGGKSLASQSSESAHRGGQPSRSWVTASDLEDWSSRREAQETLL